MRIGQNPAKSIDSVAQAKQVTVAVVSYIPFIGGYYSRGLDVLKISLESIWENTEGSFDLLVFDNASCHEVRTYLIEKREQGLIQYLTLSDKNVGKGGAWNFIFGAAPGEYLAYADGDIMFYPGWLSALLGVMETFPKAGMVTGMPLLNPEEFSTSTIKWAEQNPEAQMERGQLLSWEDYWRHAGTLGVDEGKARIFYEEHDAIRLNYQGKKYFVGAGHFQFLAPREVLHKLLPLPSERPMGQMRNLDIAINNLGYLRLCTSEWWLEHMGNTPPSIVKGSSDFKTAIRSNPSRGIGNLWRWKPLRNLLIRFYNKSFDILYRN
jgi:glycosyltransferase involved in cell wall biosynthesis